jgi:Fanconi anemia group J protein
VIDPNVRKQATLDLEGQILIIDEAHNIESTCREAAGLTLTIAEIEMSKERAFMSDTLERLYPTLKDAFTALYGLLDNLHRFVLDKRRQYDQAPPRAQYIADPDTKALLAEWGLTIGSWPVVQESFKAILKADADNVNPEQGDRFPPEMVVNLTDRLRQVFSNIFSRNGDKTGDFRFVYQRGRDDEPDRLRIICLNPGILFSQLAESVHCVLLSSGTLSPMDALAAELECRFENRISAGHIIDRGQIQGFTISADPSGTTLTSVHDRLQRFGEQIYNGIGAILAELIPKIPGGVLLFLPSKHVQRNVVGAWRRSGLWDKLAALKRIFVEGSRECTFAKYSDSIKRAAR